MSSSFTQKGSGCSIRLRSCFPFFLQRYLLDIFVPFPFVRRLHIFDGLGPFVAWALQELTGGSATEVLLSLFFFPNLYAHVTTDKEAATLVAYYECQCKVLLTRLGVLCRGAVDGVVGIVLLGRYKPSLR